MSAPATLPPWRAVVTGAAGAPASYRLLTDAEVAQARAQLRAGVAAAAAEAAKRGVTVDPRIKAAKEARAKARDA